MAIIIIPSRLYSGGAPTSDTWVVSVNDRSGRLTLVPDAGIVINTSGQNIHVGVTPDTYVLKSGDTVWGNLLLSPSGTGYGLKLNAKATDPVDTALGATYYKTSDNTLRIFDGTSYSAVGVVGSITQSDGDLRYLKLDGSNSPMTGELQLGTQYLRLGIKGSEPISAVDGQVYFNSALNRPRIWYDGGWHNLGTAGVVQVIAGTGLLVDGVSGAAITNIGTMSVNQGADFTWTGNNSFTQPITFASGQTFDISKLYAASQAMGDIIIRTGAGWVRLPVGTDNQVLQIDSTTHLPAWKDNSNSGTLGVPTDGTYSDGAFPDWTPGVTTISDAIDDISEYLLAIAPPQSGVLTSQGLTINTPPTIVSQVKLSDMTTTMLNSWINKKSGTPLSPGDIITNGYYRQGSLTASTPSGTFRAGKVSDSSTWGSVSHKIYRWTGSAVVGSLLNTYNMTSGTLGSTGTIQLTAFTTFNSLWKQGTARINTYATSNEGYTANAIYHTGAGESNVIEYWYDSASAASPTPSFSVSPTAAEGTAILKYLSGIPYYTYNSTFLVSFAAASGIFDRCYNATAVAQFSGTGLNSNNHKFSPSVVPMYNAAYNCTGGSAKTATLDVTNQNSLLKRIVVNIYKADGTTVSANATLSYAVNTWGIGATDLIERFVDESYRLVLGTTTSWTPSTTLTDGNAQVRNGTLVHGAAGEYGSFTASGQYERFFFINSRSIGTFTFVGFNANNLSPYGTGSINMLIELESPNKFYDLAVPVGVGGPGTSISNALGGRNGLPASGGSVLNWSIGTDSTQVSGTGNNGRFRLIIILRNTTYNITQITLS